jgi:predicted RNA-binding protein with PUA-like domain
MNYWLMKTEPGTFSWDDLVKAKKTTWDGVRNFQARNNLKAMAKGDQVFIYHSMVDKAIVGVAKVVSDPFADPKDKNWTVVDVEAGKKLKKPVTLEQVKQSATLGNMVLAKNSRLSVQPVKKTEFDAILGLSEEK